MVRAAECSESLLVLALLVGPTASARTLADVFCLSRRGAPVARADFTQRNKVFV